MSKYKRQHKPREWDLPSWHIRLIIWYEEIAGALAERYGERTLHYGKAETWRKHLAHALAREQEMRGSL
jgi:hypothetical protein